MMVLLEWEKNRYDHCQPLSFVRHCMKLLLEREKHHHDHQSFFFRSGVKGMRLEASLSAAHRAGCVAPPPAPRQQTPQQELEATCFCLVRCVASEQHFFLHSLHMYCTVLSVHRTVAVKRGGFPFHN